MLEPAFRMALRLALPVTLLLACSGSDDETTDAAQTADAAAAADAAPPATDGGGDAASARAELCSGCEAEMQDPDDMSIHLHHVHMNVSDRARSEAFYKQFFAAEPVLLNAETEALRVSPVLLLLDEVDDAPSSVLPTALQHMGFGASDPLSWFETAQGAGIEADTRGYTEFNTDETPTVAGPGSLFTAAIGVEPPACFPVADEIAYVYVLGPDEERIELWSGSDDRMNHVHFTSPDLPATLAWYRDFFELDIADSGAFFIDDILFYFEAIGDAASYVPTDGHVLEHLAFSVTDLSAWRARADAQDIEVVSEPANTHGFESFFVRGPDGLLIELVQAAPFAELCPGE